jgi:CheY-like chemotaxis protein
MNGKVALIVEDHESVREVLASALQRMGWQVLSASDGESGLRSAGSFRPDVVLCDLRLPGLDGLALIDAIRQQAPGATTPAIVALTGYSLAHRRDELLAHGCDAYFEKPVDLEQLQETLERLAWSRS